MLSSRASCSVPKGIVQCTNPDLTEAAEASVKMECSSPACTTSNLVHRGCFQKWEQKVLAYLESDSACGDGTDRQQQERAQERMVDPSWWDCALPPSFIACQCGLGRLRLLVSPVEVAAHQEAGRLQENSVEIPDTDCNWEVVSRSKTRSKVKTKSSERKPVQIQRRLLSGEEDLKNEVQQSIKKQQLQFLWRDGTPTSSVSSAFPDKRQNRRMINEEKIRCYSCDAECPGLTEFVEHVKLEHRNDEERSGMLLTSLRTEVEQLKKQVVVLKMNDDAIENLRLSVESLEDKVAEMTHTQQVILAQMDQNMGRLEENEGRLMKTPESDETVNVNPALDDFKPVDTLELQPEKVLKGMLVLILLSLFAMLLFHFT